MIGVKVCSRAGIKFESIGLMTPSFIAMGLSMPQWLYAMLIDALVKVDDKGEQKFMC